MEFSAIPSYEQRAPGVYQTIPEEPTVCSFNVGTNCKRLQQTENGQQVASNRIYEIEILGSVGSLEGTVGKIKNPYSTVANF